MKCLVPSTDTLLDLAVTTAALAGTVCFILIVIAGATTIIMVALERWRP
jgi:hypothetical protein